MGQEQRSGSQPETKKPNKGGFFGRVFKRQEIQSIGRELTSGGVIFRPAKDGADDIEILMIQDAKGRWTIPKGHIEEGETAKQTAIREIGEEVGLKKIEVLGWLGKVDFKYRRENKLVLMSMQVYLVRALENVDWAKKEEWIRKVKWFSFQEAIDAIEYEDIAKLMLLARRRVRERGH